MKQSVILTNLGNTIYITGKRFFNIRFVQCILVAFGVVWIANLFFDDFFFIDDAQNENLPFYKEMGRIWISGHLPVLTTNAYLGGNILVDMVLSPFAPQTIIISLLSTVIESFRSLANIIAFINISLVIGGSYWLGRVLKINPNYSLLLGFIVATNPVFLYVFSASWWNLASAFAWFTIGIAAIMQFKQDQRAWPFVAGVIASCALFASAGTQMQFTYILFFCTILTYDLYKYSNFSKTFCMILIGVCALLISIIPIMSEYFISHGLIERINGFRNTDSFLVPSWSYIINFFNPFYCTFINWFGGYRYLPINIGYISCIFALSLFFLKKLDTYEDNVRIIFILAIISLILVFTSSQFGPLRWPFRYLPAWGLMFSLLVIYHISKESFVINKSKIYQFLAFIFVAALIQLFSSEGNVFSWSRLLFFQMFILLGVGMVGYVLLMKAQRKRYASILLWSLAVLSWIGMLSQTPTLAETHIAYPKINQNIAGVSQTNESYTIGLSPFKVKNDISELSSGHFLLFGQKSINGYSPVGHVGISKHFPHRSAHGFFLPYETLKNITAPSGLRPDKFDYQLMNIGRIFAWKNDISPEIAGLLNTAGLVIEPYNVGDRVVIKPQKKSEAVGSLTYQTVDGSITFDHEDGMTKEWFKVAPSDVERTLIFSRVFWFGYHAVIDGIEYPVSSYKDLLLKVTLPAKASGQMYLYYEPVSWKYTKWSLLLGITIFVITVVRLSKVKSESTFLSHHEA